MIGQQTKKKIFSALLLALVLLSAVFAAGCIGGPTTTLKSEREVGEAVTNISGDVDDVSQILDDIDQKFG